MRVERVRVGDVLRLQRREVTIDPLAEYPLIGVYSFGKGILHRELKAGAELGDYRFFSIEPGDLVLSNIQAWEGAIALADNGDVGTIGTHRFLSYTRIGDRIFTDWARWFFLSERGMDLIRQAAPGSTMRNRTLAIERFEALEIPLPPIEEQRLVMDRLNRLWTARDEVTNFSSSAGALAVALKDSATSGILERGVRSGWALRTIGDVADVNPRPDRLAPDALVVFVPMAAVDGTRGSIAVSETRQASEVAAGHKQFRQGDVIFARITPCMQNGKSAIFDGVTEVAYGSTEFHVIRPGPEVTSDWLHRIVRTRAFRDAAAERFVGTAGQQRVPADCVRNARIPIPPVEQQAEVVSEIDQLSSRFLEVAKLRERASRILFALQPAALHEAFAELS